MQIQSETSQIIELPVIQVLLPIHFGSKYLAEQLHSLVNQSDVKIKLIAGLYDADYESRNILNDFICFFDSCEIVQISKLSPVLDYFDLILASDQQYFTAFCDQDDIWLPQKLITGYRSIQLSAIPALSVVGWKTIDEDGYFLSGVGPSFPINPITYFFQNPFLGSAMLLNPQAICLLKRIDPNRVVMHDWLVTLLLYLEGCIVVSSDYLLLYRIHQNNAIGLSSYSFRKYLCNRLNFGYFASIKNQASYLSEICSSKFNDSARVELDKLLDFFNHFPKKGTNWFMLTNKFRQTFVDDILFKVGFIMVKVFGTDPK